MTGTLGSYLRQATGLLLAALLSLTLLLPPTALPVAAASGDRTLHLHYTHTGETGRFTFKRNGRYDQKVLKQLNVFLADWRTKEPTNMDPALFDLLWSVYQEVGGRHPINIVSSYRSPKTNAMLRSKSSGVAQNSQHMTGKAIDFFIPGVNLTKLREVAMRHQVGGVGYYPTSGSPFVHLDTGNVRAWPRMTRAQLKKVFPDGKTLHLPTDGKPLSADGRRYAMAEWQKCRTVPCNGRPAATTRLASADAPVPASKPRTLMDMFFGGDDRQPQPAGTQVAALTAPAQRTVPAIEITAPVPAPPRHLAGSTAQTAPIPVPAQKSSRLLLATQGAPPAGEESALTALAALEAPLPQPRVLLTDARGGEVVTAYAPNAGGTDGPQLDLRRIIEDGGALPVIAGTPDPRMVLDPDNIQTASLGGGTTEAGNDIFERTSSALRGTTSPAPVATALAELAASRQSDDSISTRRAALVAPEIDHVNETLVHPVPMSSQHFAVMTEAEGYLDKATELGPLTGRMAFGAPSLQPVAHDHFVSGRPLLVAAR